MGKANRQRRRTKERARKRAPSTPPSGGAWSTSEWASNGWPAGSPHFPPPPPPPPVPVQERVAAALVDAIHALDRRDMVAFSHAAARLAAGDGSAEWRRLAERALTNTLRSQVTTLWRRGWQPADLLRVTGRRLGDVHQGLIRATIAAELTAYAPGTLDPRWAGQLAEGQVLVWWPPSQTFLSACAGQHRGGWVELVGCAVELFDLLVTLPSIERLGPLPGTATPTVAGPERSVDERILTRVRALLAKAESTPYPAEAETFTAGAQALMARHSIDHALLAATGRAGSDEPTGRRIGIDNPYEAPKTSLLNAVATANRCQVVWNKTFSFCTVVGFGTDLDAVELLFTSLLVQAITAMTQAGAKTDRDGRSRTRSFRQSFLIAYAGRIGERLTETIRAQTVEAAAEPTGRNLLPVLAARHDEVKKTTAELFPRLRSGSAGTAWDSEGWASGRAAADLASLNPAAQLPR